MRRHRPQNKYTINFNKKIQEAMSRAGLSYKGKALSSYNLSVIADAMPLPGLRLPASASLPLASCWPRPQQLLPVSATGGGRRRCPRGGALGRPGHFLLDAESPTWRKRAGLATEGSSFWTSAPYQAVAGLDSGALPFPGHRALLVQWKPDRHASGSPFGGAGERSETERARPLRQNKNTAIR